MVLVFAKWLHRVAKFAGTPPGFCHFLRRKVTLVGILGHHPGSDGRKFLGNIGAHHIQRGRVDLCATLEFIHDTASIKRYSTGQQVVECHSEAVDIAANVDLARIIGLSGEM